MPFQLGATSWNGTSASAIAGLGLAGFAALGAVRYADAPPSGHTGGFGEPTCVRCHADSPPHDDAALLTLDGAPETCAPGRSVPLTLRLTRPGMARAGFQMSARFAEGPRAGEQAGALSPPDARVQVVAGRALTSAGDSTDVEYAQHTVPGTHLLAPDSAEWAIRWTTPEAAAGPVALHVAANAANDDDSELGDHITTAVFRACSAHARDRG